MNEDQKAFKGVVRDEIITNICERFDCLIKEDKDEAYDIKTLFSELLNQDERYKFHCLY